MKKLKLEHLAPYLPYNIECILSEKGIFNLDSEFGVPYQATKPMKIINILLGSKIEIEIHSEKTNWGVGFVELDEIKPILRPLSDLKIFHELEFKKYNEGKKYDKDYIEWFSYEQFQTMFCVEDIDDFLSLLPQYMLYGQIEWLLKNHFDIFGLIENNLAIDINSIK